MVEREEGVESVELVHLVGVTHPEAYPERMDWDLTCSIPGMTENNGDCSSHVSTEVELVGLRWSSISGRIWGVVDSILGVVIMYSK